MNYKDLGLSNTKEMFERAYKNGYAVPAFNFNNMEQLQAIVHAASETKSPVILQCSKGARDYVGLEILPNMVKGAVQYARKLGSSAPIALHLDHGDTFETAKQCIDVGFSSVMIDGSHHSYDKNVELTKQVVEYAHKHDVTVESELGVLAGVEDDVSSEQSHYTKPEEVQDFVGKTSCDSLAISIGTSHGAFKFPPGTKAQLRFDILKECEKKIPGFPIVLHGASSVEPEYVALINKFGGKIDDAAGVPNEQLREASRSAVCKINVDTDGRLAFTSKIREVFGTNPKEFDPRKYLGPAREEMYKYYVKKIKEVFGSNDRY